MVSCNCRTNHGGAPRAPPPASQRRSEWRIERHPIPRSSSRISKSTLATSKLWTVSTSTSKRARYLACSAPTAPVKPPPSACSAACSSPHPAQLPSAAMTSPSSPAGPRPSSASVPRKWPSTSSSPEWRTSSSLAGSTAWTSRPSRSAPPSWWRMPTLARPPAAAPKATAGA